LLHLVFPGFPGLLVLLHFVFLHLIVVHLVLLHVVAGLSKRCQGNCHQTRHHQPADHLLHESSEFPPNLRLDTAAHRWDELVAAKLQGGGEQIKPSRISVRGGVMPLTSPTAGALRSRPKHGIGVFQALTLLRFVFLSTSATNLRVTGTSRLWRGAARKIGPAIASSSGRLPRSTSFCMELRMLPGKLLIVEITESASTFAPSASATAQASRTQISSSCRHVASAAISPLVLSAAVVTSAIGA